MKFWSQRANWNEIFVSLQLYLITPLNNLSLHLRLMSDLLQKYQAEPWMAWLLIVLARQRKRQYWLNEIHETIKQEKDFERMGTVPGHPEWKYQYHGKGLLLIGPNNEHLDVDFHDEKCETIDPYFFTNRLFLFGFDTPEEPEARLQFWLPEVELVISAIRELQKSVLEPEDSKVFRLNNTYDSDWEYFAQDDLDYNQLLTEVEGDESLLQRHQESFTKWLLNKLQKEDIKSSELEVVLKNLPPQIRVKHCLPYLSKVDHKMAAALKALDSLENPPVEEVISLLGKLIPTTHHPYLGYTICDFLLKRNLHKTDCIQMLRGFSDVRVVENYHGNPYDYRLVLQILTYSPKDGIDLIQRALTSTTPDSVQKASSLMAVIDEEWSNRELVKALSVEETDDRKGNKRYLVAALMNSKHTKYQQIGIDNLAPVKPRANDAGGFTRDEVIAKNMKANLAYRMKEAREDLEQLDLERIRELIQ